MLNTLLQVKVLQLLKDRSDPPRAPQVLVHGHHPESGEAYMVTEPLGTHLDRSCPASAITTVIFDVAETIIKNSVEEPCILHRDVSAPNIIMDPGGRGVLIDYQVTRQGGLQKEVRPY